MEKVVVTKGVVGLCHMQLCCEKKATDEEILTVANKENPSGTMNGWVRVERVDPENPKSGEVVCADDADRIHVLAVC